MKSTTKNFKNISFLIIKRQARVQEGGGGESAQLLQ